MVINSTELADAIAADIEPTDPGVLDSHPWHVLLNTTTGETWSLDPEDYRWFDGQPHDELVGSMEIQVESAWHEALENDQKTVLVPAHLIETKS
jgi:hypothetical protein